MFDNAVLLQGVIILVADHYCGLLLTACCSFSQDIVMLNGFGTVVNALGKRVKPYLPQICGTILWRLNNKSAKVRQQAADLISRIAQVMMTCGEVGIWLLLIT